MRCRREKLKKRRRAEDGREQKSRREKTTKAVTRQKGRSERRKAKRAQKINMNRLRWRDAEAGEQYA